MSKNIVTMPYQYFPDFNIGRPIFNGQIFIGKPGLDPEVVVNRVDVTLSDGTVIPQPVRTSSGGLIEYNNSPVSVFVDGNYSIKVLDSKGAQIYLSLNMFQGVPITEDSLSVAIQYGTAEEMQADVTVLPDGKQVSWGGYYVDGDEGGNTGVVKSGAHTDDGGSIFSIAGGKYVQAIFDANKGVGIMQFGAKGDGVTDDRVSIQSAWDFAIVSRLNVIHNPCSVHYLINSTNPDHTESGLTLDIPGDAACLTLSGSYYYSKLTAGVAMTNLVGVIGRCNDLNIENMLFDAAKLAQNSFYTEEAVTADYCPYWSITRSAFLNAIDTGLSLSSFVTTMDRNLFSNCARGVYYRGISGSIVTATTFINCYAIGCAVGYNIKGAVYSSMVSCAADSCDLAYSLDGCTGFSMTACGAESGGKIMLANRMRKFSIDQLYTLSVGSSDSGNPTDYLIEFTGGSSDVVMTGISIGGGTFYDYKIGLTSVADGIENFTMLDDSVKRAEVYIVSPSFFHKGHTFKFLWDQYDVDFTVDVSTVQEFEDALVRFKYHVINAKVIINLLADLDGNLNIINIYRGDKQLEIKGNGFFIKGLYIESSEVLLENIVFNSSGGSFFNVIRGVSSVVTATNCVMTSVGTVGAAFAGSQGSTFNIGAGTIVTGNNWANAGVSKTFNDSDGTTVWNMHPVTVAAGIRLPLGVIVGTIGTTDTLISCKVESPYAVASPDWKLL
ncbi:MAG: phage tailspike protein [Nitrosomonadaceae bacterium]